MSPAPTPADRSRPPGLSCAVLRALPFALAALALFAAAPVRADEARDLFEEGTAAIHAGGYDHAAQLLERSLELSARPATAFNLMTALRFGRRLRDAEALCRRLHAGDFGELDEAKRTQVQERCDTLAAEIPRLTIDPEVVGLLAGPLSIEVDGRVVATLEQPEPTEIRVDPGEHVVRLHAPGAIGAATTLELDRGATRRAGLTLRGSAAPDPAATRRRRLRRGLGIGAGVVALGVLAGILGAVLRPADPGPTNGDLGPAGT